MAAERASSGAVRLGYWLDGARRCGHCGLTSGGNGLPGEPELAYELLRATHGHGYATEAARSVIRRAADAGYRRLWAGVWDWNTASRRVLEKVGFLEVRQIEPRSVYGHTLLTRRDFSAHPIDGDSDASCSRDRCCPGCAAPASGRAGR